jgi:hypothetical protein
MAAAVALPSFSPINACIHAHTSTCECYYEENEDAHKCDDHCDCACINCCITRFANVGRACYRCGGTPLDGQHTCRDCEKEEEDSDDDESYGRPDYDERSYGPSEHDDDYDDRDHEGGCVCFRCGCSYDPADSDYGGRACSEPCLEGWGDEY